MMCLGTKLLKLDEALNCQVSTHWMQALDFWLLVGFQGSHRPPLATRVPTKGQVTMKYYWWP